MESASRESIAIRVAVSSDAVPISRLLKTAKWVHSQTDWRLPADWIGSPAFVVGTNGRQDLVACLYVEADPPPAAWIRLAAFHGRPNPQPVIQKMLDAIEPYLCQVGVRQLGWLLFEGWRDDWLTNMGFRRVNWITTFINDRVAETPSRASSLSQVAVRQATREDISVLVDIEELAFEPIWRHSINGLTQALDHSLCFDVALINKKIVGFQYSVTGSRWDSAHLVRITVDPGVQQSGVGSALLTSAFDHYRHKGLQLVTLNTQVDNAASQRLYEKFGFRVIGNQIPMWSKTL